MKTTRKGSAAENRVRRELEAGGWLMGSRRHIGGAGDWLAFREGRAWLIEVKATKRRYGGFPPSDRAALREEAERHGAEAVLAWCPSPARPIVFIAAADWPR